jgi:hypothetical protein
VAGSWRAFSAAVMIAAALPQCLEASTNDPEPVTGPCQKQTSYTFECYTLDELQQIADAAARDSGRAPVDAGAAGATATGPLLLSCPSPDGDTYPPLSGFRDGPPPGSSEVSVPGKCCYYRAFSFCPGL